MRKRKVRTRKFARGVASVGIWVKLALYITWPGLVQAGRHRSDESICVLGFFHPPAPTAPAFRDVGARASLKFENSQVRVGPKHLLPSSTQMNAARDGGMKSGELTSHLHKERSTPLSVGDQLIRPNCPRERGFHGFGFRNPLLGLFGMLTDRGGGTNRANEMFPPGRSRTGARWCLHPNLWDQGPKFQFSLNVDMFGIMALVSNLRVNRLHDGWQACVCDRDWRQCPL